MPQLDFYSYTYQFRWGIGVFLMVFWVLINYVFPKFLYRESSGVLKREVVFVRGVAWEEEGVIDFYYKC